MTNDVFHMVCDALTDYELRFCSTPEHDDARIVLHPYRFREALADSRYFMFCGSIGLLFNRPMIECGALNENQVLVIAPPHPQAMAEAVLASIEFWSTIAAVPTRVECSPEDIHLIGTSEQALSWNLRGVHTNRALPPGMFWLEVHGERVTAVVRPHQVEWLNLAVVPPLPFMPRRPEPEEAPHILTAAIQDLYTACATVSRDEIAAIYGVPSALLASPGLPIAIVGDSSCEQEPFGEPGGEPAVDICDEISILVDDQLVHEASGYDHNIHQPRCACGEDWHGLPITQKMREMRGRRLLESDYVYAKDKSEVLCPGTPTAGTWRGAKNPVVDLGDAAGRLVAGGGGGWIPIAVSLWPEFLDDDELDIEELDTFYPGGYVAADPCTGLVTEDSPEVNMDDRPLSREERRTVERIGFLRRLGIYDGDPPMPGEDDCNTGESSDL